jgi:hypothetical protein
MLMLLKFSTPAVVLCAVGTMNGENVGLLVPALFAIVIVKPILLNDLGN